MFMLAYWLLNKAPAHMQTLEVVFPIVGHSFLPPDRVLILQGSFKESLWARLEKQSRTGIL
nr:unnamed protein product [Callosobruchus chinensis]